MPKSRHEYSLKDSPDFLKPTQHRSETASELGLVRQRLRVIGLALGQHEAEVQLSSVVERSYTSRVLWLESEYQELLEQKRVAEQWAVIQLQELATRDQEPESQLQEQGRLRREVESRIAQDAAKRENRISIQMERIRDLQSSKDKAETGMATRDEARDETPSTRRQPFDLSSPFSPVYTSPAVDFAPKSGLDIGRQPYSQSPPSLSSFSSQSSQSSSSSVPLTPQPLPRLVSAPAHNAPIVSAVCSDANQPPSPLSSTIARRTVTPGPDAFGALPPTPKPVSAFPQPPACSHRPPPPRQPEIAPTSRPSLTPVEGSKRARSADFPSGSNVKGGKKRRVDPSKSSSTDDRAPTRYGPPALSPFQIALEEIAKWERRLRESGFRREPGLDPGV